MRELESAGFSGLCIFDEFTGTGAYLLWVSFRDAELWVQRETDTALFWRGDDGRAELIDDLEPEDFGGIKSVLHSLARLVQGRSDAGEVASGCDQIAGWSELRSCLRTAIEYAQVASLALPSDAGFAVRTARLLRMRSEYARAHSWFDYAIYLARLTTDWDAYARAYSGLGCLFMQRGNLPRARIVLRRSLRAALRNELPERTASAYHNLFAVEATAGDWEKAEKFAQLALRWYPPNARGVPRLARDLAFRWIQRGYFDRALPLAKEALHHFSAQADRALVWSDIARAAAASGEAETFEDAWARAWVLVREGHVEPFGADILLNLAHGAASQGDTTRARLAAERALELGRATKEAQILFEAESVLDSLREPVRTMQATETVSESSQLLANKFVRLLSRTRAAA